LISMMTTLIVNTGDSSQLYLEKERSAPCETQKADAYIDD